ncbi:MAG TPA: cobyrinic acid a,c-diamide synthase, partial [Nitrospirota bacterium]
GKAQAKGVPIISVADDTFTTIDKIEGSMGKTNIREKRKVARVKELMDIEFDMKRFLKSVANSK